MFLVFVIDSSVLSRKTISQAQLTTFHIGVLLLFFFFVFEVKERFFFLLFLNPVIGCVLPALCEITKGAFQSTAGKQMKCKEKIFSRF